MLPSLDGTVPASLSAQRRPPLAAVELFGAGTVAAGSGAVTEFGVTACTPGVFTSSSAASSWRTAPNPLMTGTSPVVLWPPRSATTCWPCGGGHARLHLDDVLGRNALFGERVARSEDENHAERCGERYCEPKPKDDGELRHAGIVPPLEVDSAAEPPLPSMERPLALRPRLATGLPFSVYSTYRRGTGGPHRTYADRTNVRCLQA